MAIHVSKRILRFFLIVSFLLFCLIYTFSGEHVTSHVKNNKVAGYISSNMPSFMVGKQQDVLDSKDKEGEQMRLEAEHSQEVGETPVDPSEPQFLDEDAKALMEAANGQSSNASLSAPSDDKVKACFVSLVRNSDMWSIINSVRAVEDRFNRNYNYTWVFLNNEPFSEDFKRVVSNVIGGKAEFGLIPSEHWSYPEWIDQDKAAETRTEMANNNIIYGDSESYRHMCRYESGFFWRHPLLDEFDWYWRVEPDIKLYCDIDYDVFKWMQDNNKVYGFTISIHEYESTIKTLWKTTKEFMEQHPEHIHENNMMDFISDDGGKSYNLCHFWSNFEVASLKFWRSTAYREYFDYLDKAGGFFYERWGDAPVHSIAAALFLPRDQIHYFPEIGYHHPPYDNCPIDKDIWAEKKCSCNPDNDFTFKGYSCGKKYYDVNKLEKPKEWKKHT